MVRPAPDPSCGWEGLFHAQICYKYLTMALRIVIMQKIQGCWKVFMTDLVSEHSLIKYVEG